MNPQLPAELASRTQEIARICARLGVRRLEVFGSAARGAGHPADLDFLVDLGELPPRQYAEAYFQLRASLEALFHLPVDLVTPANLENPYFRQRVEREKTLVYAA
jgi:predicted nucleotidyltransferase